MSTYKQFTSKDVIITPFSVGKRFTYEGNELTSTGVEIDFFQGINNTIRFDNGKGSVLPFKPTGLLNTQYKALVYNDIKQLYYTNYLPNSDAQFFPPTSSYFLGTTNQNHRYENYLASLVSESRYYPTESNAEVTVISIPSKCYGNYIRPNSFAFTYGTTTLYDDGEGNLYTPEDTSFSVYGSGIYGINVYGDTSAEKLNVGNIIYSHGIVVITTGSLNGIANEISSSYGLGGVGSEQWTNGIGFQLKRKGDNPTAVTQSTLDVGQTPSEWFKLSPGTSPIIQPFIDPLIPSPYTHENMLNATCSLSLDGFPSSSWLIVKDFDFNIPTNATIKGISVVANMGSLDTLPDSNYPTVNQVKVAPSPSQINTGDNGIVYPPSYIGYTVDNTNDLDTLNPTGKTFDVFSGSRSVGSCGLYYDAYCEVGAQNYQWGHSWNVSDVNSNDFSVGIQCNIHPSTGGDWSIYCKYIYASVYYSLPGDTLLSASISFESDVQVYENQYKCTFGEDEYNFSLNPSNLSGSNITYSGSNLLGYSGDSETVLDFTTGSAFSPYITTVGLYNNNQELIAVGKLSQPLQSSRNTDTTLLVNFDT